MKHPRALGKVQRKAIDARESFNRSQIDRRELRKKEEGASLARAKTRFWIQPDRGAQPLGLIGAIHGRQLVRSKASEWCHPKSGGAVTATPSFQATSRSRTSMRRRLLNTPVLVGLSRI
jgi:hypothetical protein